MFVFQKIWRALFSCDFRFEISPFALLPKTRKITFANVFIKLESGMYLTGSKETIQDCLKQRLIRSSEMYVRHTMSSLYHFLKQPRSSDPFTASLQFLTKPQKSLSFKIAMKRSNLTVCKIVKSYSKGILPPFYLMETLASHSTKQL